MKINHSKRLITEYVKLFSEVRDYEIKLLVSIKDSTNLAITRIN